MDRIKPISEILWDIKRRMAASTTGNDQGICALVDIEFAANYLPVMCYYRAMDDFDAALKAWPEHTGRRCYPVPSSVAWLSPVEAFYDLHRWSGEYGGNRMRLLNFLIRYFEAKENA